MLYQMFRTVEEIINCLPHEKRYLFILNISVHELFFLISDFAAVAENICLHTKSLAPLIHNQ